MSANSPIIVGRASRGAAHNKVIRCAFCRRFGSDRRKHASDYLSMVDSPLETSAPEKCAIAICTIVGDEFGNSALGVARFGLIAD